jgi:thiol-disulfide isomerase/thioredoxin
MHRHRAGAFAVAVIVVLAAAALLAACGSSSGGGEATDTDTDTEIEFISPGDFSVSAYAGQPLVLNFFGSWCPPCRAEAPDFGEFVAANPDVAVVGVAVNDTETAAGEFMEEFGLAYPVVVDDNSLGAQWGVSAVPTTIFFDAAGNERDRIVGAATREQFDQSLAKAQ